MLADEVHHANKIAGSVGLKHLRDDNSSSQTSIDLSKVMAI
jgi:hypothetical protein